MITTILLGFSDTMALTAPKIISGLDAKTIDQINIFDDAKSRHKFPEGIKCIVRANVELTDRAVFISDKIADGIANAEKLRIESDAKEKAAAKELLKAQSAGQESWNKVRDAAKKRNDLMGRLNSAKSNLRNHEITPEAAGEEKINLRSPTWKSDVEKLKLLIFGDPAKKVAGLEQQVADAVAEYDKALAAHDAATKTEQSAPVSQLA